LTMSATLHLPIAAPYEVTAEDEQRLKRELRDVRFNADRHDLGPAAEPLIAEKRSLIAAQLAARTNGLTRRQRRLRSRENQQRYRRLQEVNEQLSSLASGQREDLLEQLREVQRQLAVNRVLLDREFPYCLYPPQMLREFFASSLQ